MLLFYEWINVQLDGFLMIVSIADSLMLSLFCFLNFIFGVCKLLFVISTSIIINFFTVSFS